MLFKPLLTLSIIVIMSTVFTKSEEEVPRIKRGVGLGIAGLGIGGLGAAGIAGIGIAGAGIAGAGILGAGIAGAGIAKAGVAGAGLGLGLGLAGSGSHHGYQSHYGGDEEVQHIYVNSYDHDDYYEPKHIHHHYYH